MHSPAYVPVPSPSPLCNTHHGTPWVRGTRLSSIHPPPHLSPMVSSSRACHTSPQVENLDGDAATNPNADTSPIQNTARRHHSKKAPPHATMDSYLQCVECYALYIVEPEELDHAPRIVGCSNCLHEWYATEADLLWGEEEALEALGKRDIKEHVERQLPPLQPLESDGGVNIFVGNLSFRATIDDLHRAFRGYGEVVRCQIPSDASGASRGFGFVEMKRRKEGLLAIKNLHGVSILGRDVALTEARQREGGDLERRKRKDDKEDKERLRGEESGQGKRGKEEGTAKSIVKDARAKADLDENLGKQADEGGTGDRPEEGKVTTDRRRWKMGEDPEKRKVIKTMREKRDEKKAGRAGGGRSKRGMGMKTVRRQKETLETGRDPASSKKG